MKRNVRTGAGLLAVLFLFAGAAMAQQKKGGAPDPEKAADRQIAMMKERLKLTGDQEAKLKPIFVDSMKKQVEMRQKYGPPQPGQRPSKEAMAEMRQAREDTNKRLSEVLSKEQMDEYQKILAERRGPGGGFGGGKKKKQ